MFQVLAYIKYWLQQVDEHSLHSPFLFEFYNDLVRQATVKPDREIEILRKALIQSKQQIEFQELGAGSRLTKSSQRKISTIAKYSTTPLKFSLFLNALIKKYAYSQILELGTSLGINTLYMAQVDQVQVTTIEGEPSIAEMAQKHFKSKNASNIELHQGAIDQIISSEKLKDRNWDLVYMDANHAYAPTLRYFDYCIQHLNPHGVIVLDDIHWSKGMHQAWKEIKARPEISLTLDLFEAGLVFIDPDLPKANYVLKF